MTAVLTGDTPRWLFLVRVGVGVAAYLGCAVLSLTARSRLARRRPRPAPTAHVITTRAREEITS